MPDLRKAALSHAGSQLALCLLASAVGCAQVPPPAADVAGDDTAGADIEAPSDDGAGNGGGKADDTAAEVDSAGNMHDGGTQPVAPSCEVTATALFAGRLLAEWAYTNTRVRLMEGSPTTVFVSYTYFPTSYVPKLADGTPIVAHMVVEYDWLADKIVWKGTTQNPHFSYWSGALFRGPPGTRVAAHVGDELVAYGDKPGDQRFLWPTATPSWHEPIVTHGARVAFFSGSTLELLEWSASPSTGKQGAGKTLLLLKHAEVTAVLPNFGDTAVTFASDGTLWFATSHYPISEASQPGRNVGLCKVDAVTLKWSCPVTSVLHGMDNVIDFTISDGVAFLLGSQRPPFSKLDKPWYDKPKETLVAALDLSSGSALWWRPAAPGPRPKTDIFAGILRNAVTGSFAVKTQRHKVGWRLTSCLGKGGLPRGVWDEASDTVGPGEGVHVTDDVTPAGDGWVVAYHNSAPKSKPAYVFLRRTDDFGNTSCAHASKCMGQALASCPVPGACQRQVCDKTSGCALTTDPDGTSCSSKGLCKAKTCVSK